MNINNSLNEVKTDLMSEANLNINLRRLVYDYYSPDPDKKRRLAKQRRLNKIPGFKEAKVKFMNKQKHSRDTFLVKDALLENPPLLKTPTTSFFLVAIPLNFFFTIIL